MAKTPKKPARKGRKAATTGNTTARRATRQGTKQAKVLELLRRPEGATIAQLVKATGWQPHTVRGAMAGALKKRLGIEIKSEKPEDGERVYRVG
jgi:hypothetical protein